MKTARDLLLRRHATAQGRLDSLRSEFIAGLPGPVSTPTPASPTETGWRFLWQELFVRARTAWTGLAAAGVIALALNASVPRRSLPTGTPAPASTQAALAELVEERTRLLADLFGSPGPTAPVSVPHPSPALPTAPAGPRRSSVDPSRPDQLHA